MQRALELWMINMYCLYLCRENKYRILGQRRRGSITVNPPRTYGYRDSGPICKCRNYIGSQGVRVLNMHDALFERVRTAYLLFKFHVVF